MEWRSSGQQFAGQRAAEPPAAKRACWREQDLALWIGDISRNPAALCAPQFFHTGSFKRFILLYDQILSTRAIRNSPEQSAPELHRALCFE